jgi:hypothetical protein
LITKKKISNVNLTKNFLFFLENLIQKILSNSFQYMIRGKRTILTFDDLKKSLSDFIDVNNLSEKKSLYQKPLKDLNLLTKKLEKKENLNTKKIYSISFVEDWMTFSANKKYRKKETIQNLPESLVRRKNIKNSSKLNLSSLSFSLLTSKQQFFYQYLIAVFKRGSKKEQEACLESLAEDRGLFPIVPYLIIFMNNFLLTETIFSSKLELSIKLIRALFLNDSFKLEPFIHEILPILVKFVIGDFFPNSSYKMVSLRLYSANIIGFILHRFGQRYVSLYSRLTFYFSKRFFDSREEIFAIHGALIGLNVLGNKTLELFVLPFLPIILERIENEIRKKKSDFETIATIKNLINFIIKIFTSYLLNKNLDYVWHEQGKIHDGDKIEIIYKIYPKIKDLKNLIDTFCKKDPVVSKKKKK